MSTSLATENEFKKIVRETTARCIRDSVSVMMSRYGSGRNNERLTGSQDALFEFAKSMYRNIYGVNMVDDIQDFETFLNECHLVF